MPAFWKIPTSVWIGGGVGVAALASFATFALVGAQKHASLRDSCAPRCIDDQTRPVRVDYAIGDISLAVSAVAFGVATWLFFTRPEVVMTTGQSGSVMAW